MSTRREYRVIFTIQDSDVISEDLHHALTHAGLSPILLATGHSSNIAMYIADTTLPDEHLVSDLEGLIDSVGEVDHGTVTLVISDTDGDGSHYAMPEEGGHFVEISHEEFEELNQDFPGIAS
jgi:hypothetical protein